MSIFEQLKRNTSQSVKPVAKIRDKVFFQLNFDQQGAYLDIIGTSGNQVEVDYRQFSGNLRSLIRNIQLIRERHHFTIDWENPENHLYLHEHPYLILQLIESGLMVNQQRKTINHLPQLGQLQLKIQPIEEDQLSVQTVIKGIEDEYRDFLFLNEEYAYLPEHNSILKTQPAGNQFFRLQAFNSAALPKSELQKYLSLYFSYVENVQLIYESYQLKKELQPLKARPALIFEKVDTDQSLYLRVGQVLPNADIHLLEDYDLFQYAIINEMEETITTRPIEQLSLEVYLDQVEKLLQKHTGKGKRKKESGIFREENFLLIPQHVAAGFIYYDVPNLIGEFALIGSEKLQDYKINIHPPRLNVQLSHGIDFLEGDASLEFGDQQISLMDAITQYSQTRYILLSDGSRALVNDAYMNRMQRLFKKRKDKVALSFFDLPVVEELIDEKIADQQFGWAKEVFEGFNQLATQKIRLPKLKAKLRPYQVQGYKWMKYLYENNFGGCLADDMGLGKTLQTITLLANIYKKSSKELPSLVVMPRSLLYNWENELKKFAPQLTYYIWYGNQRDMKEATQCHLVLTTYAMIRNDIEKWKEQEFLCCILDESQAIKGLNSKISRAVMLLKSRHRFSLSGTPVENNLSELYALFRFLNPSMFGSAENFNRNYLNPIQKNDDKEATHELKRKIYPFILRRLKKDVAKELPDKIEQTLYVEMSRSQASYYEQRRAFYQQAIAHQVAQKGIQQSQFFIFQAMNELRQIASVPQALTDGKIQSSKTELLMEQLDDALANRHKILVFCNFLAAVESIGEELDQRGVDFLTMTGSTRNRQQLVDLFQSDSNCRVFIMTLKTGGTGLNLTAADMVFIYDPWWNKAAENQAIDRTHRIGQDKKVMSYKMISLGTIEEKIQQLQEMKSTLFENIISTDSASIKSLNQEDLDFILSK